MLIVQQWSISSSGILMVEEEEEEKFSDDWDSNIHDSDIQFNSI